MQCLLAAYSNSAARLKGINVSSEDIQTPAPANSFLQSYVTKLPTVLPSHLALATY